MNDLDGVGCDRVSDLMLGSDSDVGGLDISSSRAAFSAMAPEPVFPSPPSDRGLVRDEDPRRSLLLRVWEVCMRQAQALVAWV